MNALIMNCSPVKNGATAEIANIVSACLEEKYEVRKICIDDYSFKFCTGCRSCHSTAKCIQHDDVDIIIEQYEWADIIISISPSYWADIPGQFKAFIDRCTPWCNTHEPHAAISNGKKGYSIALRTGPNMKECNRIIESIEHFYGHMEIECCDRLGLCSIEYKEDVKLRKVEIIKFCNNI
ncbi:MAG: flavodoxin family protein [Oscillospiraceae bacterium]|nr:flavodoxin family protein [Oscillospiraceae bacterium]